MSGEFGQYPSRPEELHRKLSSYLLTRTKFGIGNTGMPNDGLYYTSGELLISDYLTAFHLQDEYSAQTLEARREALVDGESIINVELPGGPALTLVRPDRLRPMLITDAWTKQGLDMDTGELVLFDSQQGVRFDYPLPIQYYLEELPPI